jgi:hypothetical protein
MNGAELKRRFNSAAFIPAFFGQPENSCREVTKAVNTGID